MVRSVIAEKSCPKISKSGVHVRGCGGGGAGRNSIQGGGILCNTSNDKLEEEYFF